MNKNNLWFYCVVLIISFSERNSAFSAEGEQTLMPLKMEMKARAGSFSSSGGNTNVGISANQGQETRVTLCQIDSPPITNQVYAIRGEVRYKNVHGNAYLEMLSAFEKGKKLDWYFSKTLSDTGMAKKLSGDSEWRDFILIFNRLGVDGPAPDRIMPPPTKLEFGVTLPLGGEISLRNISLIQYDQSIGIPNEVAGLNSSQIPNPSQQFAPFDPIKISAGMLAACLEYKPIALQGSPIEVIANDNRILIKSASESTIRICQFDFSHIRLTQRIYAVRGKVRCQGVPKRGYLAMESIFLAGGGGPVTCYTNPVGKPVSYLLNEFQGSSDWEDFLLPFDRKQVSDQLGIKTAPVKVNLNMTLTQGGEVELKEVTLVEYSDTYANDLEIFSRDNNLIQLNNILNVTTPEKVDKIKYRLLSKIAAGLLGLLAITVIVTAKKLRRISILFGRIGCIIGSLLLLSGSITAIIRQPYEIYSPLLLLGLIGTAIFSAATVALIKITRQEELRKIAAMDAGM
ncbi:MAG: hypothetical protein ABIP97_02400 [Chthoniobacterales bacterium]